MGDRDWGTGWKFLLRVLWEQPLGARKPECVTPMDLVARLCESVADEDAD
jgi:hypothetical protein